MCHRSPLDGLSLNGSRTSAVRVRPRVFAFEGLKGPVIGFCNEHLQTSKPISPLQVHFFQFDTTGCEGLYWVPDSSAMLFD